MTPVALLLDLDGTLVDSEPLHRAAYRSYFAARGWDYDDALLGLFAGRRAEDVFAHSSGPWSGEDPAQIARDVLEHLDPALRPAPVPGGAELVATATEAGVPLAIVTSADPLWVRLTVGDGLGLHDRFQVVVTRDDVASGKPDPACYRLACEALGADPARSLAVEDSPAGVRSAVAAGVGGVYGVTTTWPRDRLLAAGATEAVPDLHALVGLLELA